MKSELPSVSSPEIAQAYNENQVSADQKYFKKTLFLTGRIVGINSGLSNEPYITLRGINPFLSPQARFNKKGSSIEKLSTLKKGQKLYLVCEGAGAIVGTPMFNNCQFAHDYAEQWVAQIKLEMIDFLKGNTPTSQFVKQKYPNLAIGIIAAVRELPDTSTCFTNGSKCLMEINAIFSKDKNAIKQKMNILGDELKVLGVKVPEQQVN